MNITEPKLYVDKSDFSEIGFSCFVDGVEHYTADIRHIANKKTAVLSDSTNCDKPKYANNGVHITKQGIFDCLEYGIYLKFDADVITVNKDYYIYIDFKYNKEFYDNWYLTNNIKHERRI